ncbi:hypothetical protein ACLWN1_13575 [Lactiplantibacillus plantarum]|uniref:hypothetical protein n=1 Tax=Lactiplantibacillus plantarum TaxID=1590 RepID=UPI0039A2DC22
MKIVINRKFGGFGLSNISMIHLAKRKGITVYPYLLRLNFGELPEHMTTTFTRYHGEPDESLKLLTQLKLFRKDLELDTFTLQDRVDLDDYMEKYDPWNWNPNDYRTDKDLIAIVTEDDKAATTRFSKLVVVDIFDGHDYEISEYDGMEQVYVGKDLQVINGED